MEDLLIFDFKADTSKLDIPSTLNNPFGIKIPEIARIAAEEFQIFVALESLHWKYDFRTRQGKMFGVLVVQREDKTYGYLGTVSGKLPGNEDYDKFVPSIFDETMDDNYFGRGMTELTEIGSQIQKSNNPLEIKALKSQRSERSKGLQKWLFENYNFLNLSGELKNLLDIFEDSSHGNPPAAAGECAAPKLLQYAIAHHLKPVALAEFWWGNSIKNNDREHKVFYSACKEKCRPILEYILEDSELYNNRAYGAEVDA